MISPRFAVSCLLLWIILGPHQAAYSDFIIYAIPFRGEAILLEGKTKVLPQGIIEYTHPTFGTITLSRDQAIIIKAPTKLEEFKKLFAKASKAKSVETYLEAARQAIRKGLIKEFYQCCAEALKLDPTNTTVKRLVDARKLVKKKLDDNEQAEKRIREVIDLPKMKVKLSEHYVLLYDTSESKVGRKRISRAEVRLQLLETVYESFFMKFAIDGLVLEPPKERMMVVLFGEERDYLRYSASIDPSLVSALGYWSPKNNVAIFFDQGTTERIKALEQFNEEVKKQKTALRGTADSMKAAHSANSIDLLFKVVRDEADIEVVSHEATHQLAGNTGLMPRGKIALRWAHEGLASYFETSTDAAWGGIGAVNEGRLKGYYRVLADPARNSIELIISDLLFDGAKSPAQFSQAYGQAWALTHFLMEKKFDKLIEYYHRTADLDLKEKRITGQDLVNIFKEVFGDLRALERDWRLYMDSLKTDIDRMRDAVN